MQIPAQPEFGGTGENGKVLLGSKYSWGSGRFRTELWESGMRSSTDGYTWYVEVGSSRVVGCYAHLRLTKDDKTLFRSLLLVGLISCLGQDELKNRVNLSLQIRNIHTYS